MKQSNMEQKTLADSRQMIEIVRVLLEAAWVGGMPSQELDKIYRSIRCNLRGLPVRSYYQIQRELLNILSKPDSANNSPASNDGGKSPRKPQKADGTDNGSPYVN